MEKNIKDKIYNIAYQIGLKSKYLENNSNRIILLNYIIYDQFEDFIERMLMISLETDIQLPFEILDYKGDREKYTQAIHIFLMGLTNGSIKRLELKNV